MFDRVTRVSLTVQILAALALGILLGWLFGANVAFLGVLGKVVIQLIKALAVPLVFLTIVDAILNTSIRARSAGWLLAVNGVNAMFAVSLGLFLSHLIRPGDSLNLSKQLSGAAGVPAAFAGKSLGFEDVILGLVPSSLVQPFLEGNILGVVVIALLFGAGLKRAGSIFPGPSTVREVLRELLKVAEVALGWMVHLVPVAVLGVTAKTVGEYGFAPFYSLSLYLVAGLLGLILHPLIVYQSWILFSKRISLRRFWREAKEVVVHAIGTNSSLATLPLTLRALDRLGVSARASRLGACVGTNLNNDGILLYEAMAVLYVAQAHGIVLTVGQELLIALCCVVAAMGVAGIPEAGVISLSLVLGAAGLPLDMLTLLLSVDWIIARARSAVNSLSDMTVSIALDRLDPPEADPQPR